MAKPTIAAVKQLRPARRLLGVLLAGALLSRVSAGAAEPCATAKEQMALQTRSVQTELLMAALNCGERDRYNAFIEDFRKPLQHQSRALKGYFKRHHGAKATVELNSFITQLANLASQRYNKGPTRFCSQTRRQLTEVLTLKTGDLPDFVARQPFVPPRSIALCDVKATTP